MSVEMKDSGIAWIGEIPKHWEVIPFKAIYSLGKGLSITKADLVEQGVPVISYGQIHSKQNTGTSIKDSLIRYVPESCLKEGKQSLVRYGDVIFADTSEDREGCGNCVFVDRNYTLFAGYHTIVAKNISDYKNNYFSYLFQTDCWRLQIRALVNGVKLFSISQKLLSTTTLILPPIEEQSRIANFLDKKCAEIDELIALQEQMIAQLNTYKQAVITETVTKGLNPDVKMKDSGVEWIGEIPEHWEIKELKFALDGLCDGTHGTFERVNHGELLLSAKNIGDNDIIIDDNESQISFEDYKKIVANGFPKKGDVLLCCVGSIGKCCLYKEEKSIAFQRSVAFLRHNSTITSEYLMYLLKSNIMQAQYDMYARKSAQSGIYMGLIKDFIIITPNAQEQKNLADYLDQKCKEIDELISIKKEKIEQLKAYKKSVIYEYVTGKKHIDR